MHVQTRGSGRHTERQRVEDHVYVYVRMVHGRGETFGVWMNVCIEQGYGLDNHMTARARTKREETTMCQ